MNTTSPEETVKLPPELIDMIIGEVAKTSGGKTRKELLGNCSVLCKRTTTQSQSYLFEGKISFYGNAGTDRPPRPGFNKWCEEIRGSDPKYTRHGPSPHIDSIHYHREGDSLKPLSEKAQMDKYVLGFTGVKRLKLSLIPIGAGPSVMPRFAELLGYNIQVLTLVDCQMNINQLVRYLSYFANLDHLTIERPDFNQVAPTALVPGRAPPNFGKTLQLGFSFHSRLQEFMRAIAGNDMGCSRIILDHAPAGATVNRNAIYTFLSKSAETLTYLKIHSESTLHPIG